LCAATASTTADSTAGAQGKTFTFQKLARKKERKKERRRGGPGTHHLVLHLIWLLLWTR
jgi:hypothetical protein